MNGSSLKQKQQKQSAHNKIKFSNSASGSIYGHMYLCIVFGSFPPNRLERVVSLGGYVCINASCPEVMLILGRRGEKIKLLHFAPRFQSKKLQIRQKKRCRMYLGDPGEDCQVHALYSPSPSAPPNESQWQ